MIKKVLPVKNFPHRVFSVIAIIGFVAFLLTLKPVAEFVKKAVEMLGITFPPMEIFRNAAANILLVAVGYVALVVAAVIVIPIVKIAVTISAIAVVGYGLYNLYKTFTKRPVQDILPQGEPQGPNNRGYGSVPLEGKK